MSESTPSQVNLLDLIAFFVRWRRFILTAVLSVTTFVAVITFVVHPRYRSSAVIRAQKSENMGIGSLVASKLGGLGGLAGLSPSFGEVSEETFVAILKSRWMSERVVDKFDLVGAYHLQGQPREAVIKALEGNARFRLDEKTGSITLMFDDESPSRAREIASYFIDQLDYRNRELSTERAAKEREFSGQRLLEERIRLAALEDSLSRFQLATGMLDVEEQVRATIQAAGQLEADRLAALSELEMKERIFGTANSEINNSRIRLASIDSTLRTLVRRKAETSGNDFLIHLEDTPEQGMVFLRLTRDIEIQQMLVSYLIQQYEQAKVEELRNTPTVLQIDPPSEPTTKIWPKRGFMIVLAALGALVVSALVAMLLDLISIATRDPEHPQYAHLANLRRSWKR
jgi:tyrosine-protein kinase Etk/Wzc